MKGTDLSALNIQLPTHSLQIPVEPARVNGSVTIYRYKHSGFGRFPASFAVFCLLVLRSLQKYNAFRVCRVLLPVNGMHIRSQRSSTEQLLGRS